MKLLLIILGFLLTSCESGDDNNPPQTQNPEPVDEGVVRFSDDFESTFNLDPSNESTNVWYESFRGQSTVELSTNANIPARSGNNCIVANMIANENNLSRAEIGVNLRQSLGDYWYGLSVFIPDNYDISQMVLDRDTFYSVLAQWGVWQNNPGLPDFALRMGHDNGVDKFFITFEPSTDFVFLWDGPLIQGEWVDWVFHIKWAKNDTGLIEVWQNNNNILSQTNFQTTDGDGSEVKSKIGMYYSNWGDRLRGYDEIQVYFDKFTIAEGEDMFDEVNPSQ
jgi:hypothetical protein